MAQKNGNRYFVWIIMILLFVGLLGFGTGGFGGAQQSIGSVGDKEISVAQYQRGLTEQLRAFEAQVGSPVSFAQAQQLGIDQAVVGQLITERTLDNEASTLGLSVGDERVRAEVLRVPAFRDLSGEFDREAYRAALERTGLNERDFETSIREEISRTMLQGAVVGGIPGPAAYADAIVQFVGEARSVTWAAVSADDLTTPLAGATDADLSAFYDANPDDFTAPEQREITFAWLTPEMIQDELTVDEEALRALYDERIAEFVRAERRLVERLVFVDQATAEDAAARLTSGEIDFDALVAERGLDLADIDMGDVLPSDLGAAADDVFAAQAGAIVGPVTSSLGPALFRMNAILAADEVSFEEASDDLREELSAARARRVIEDSVESINDLVAGGATLEDLADRTDLQLGNISWDANNQDGIAAYDNFRAEAAAAQDGDFTKITDLEDGGIFALRLDSVTPPTLRPLDDVRDDVRAAWDAQAQQTAIIAKANEFAEQINPLTGFETLGLTPTAGDALTRRSFVEGTPPAFTTEVFTMALGETKVVENASGAIVVRLDDVTGLDDADPQYRAQRQAVQGQVASGISQDIFEAFANDLQIRTDININQAALNALNAQLQ